ncbi:hypothetical protein F0T03_04075 [Yersinia canariae]|uniref:Uncharacterized protein n=1 Tax=Yersinia canariae TaxID=2607663 RepID=A0A857EVH7_9GAMM|nr:hypothetical protein F0T03_04075 [Yersinia canariae]
MFTVAFYGICSIGYRLKENSGRRELLHLLFILSGEFLVKISIKMLMRDQAVVFRKSSNRCFLHKKSPVSHFYNGHTSA